MPAIKRLPKRRILGWSCQPIKTLRGSFAGAATERVSVRGVLARATTFTFSHRLAGAVATASGTAIREKIVILTELAEGSTRVRVRRNLTYWNPEFQRINSPILRYGFAVVSVGIALGVAFGLQHYQFRDVELPVLIVAIAFATWYAGAGPSVLAVLLSSACFDYFFIEPLYSFEISSRDLPYFLIFVAWAAIVASFSAVRGRIEDSLRRARDELQVE